MEILKIKKIVPDATIPSRGTEKAAGFDLYACRFESGDGMTLNIKPHETQKIHTGIALEIPDGNAGLIYARSGLATNQGLRPANAVGVVDSDYRGEVIVALHNDTEEIQQVYYGDRIAQLLITPITKVRLKEVDDLSETQRGIGGFGSTGKK